MIVAKKTLNEFIWFLWKNWSEHFETVDLQFLNLKRFKRFLRPYRYEVKFAATTLRMWKSLF